MTNTALKNKDIKVKAQIAKMQDERTRSEGIANRGVQVASAAIGALGRVASSAAKSGGKPHMISKSLTGGISRSNSPEWYKRVPELVNVSVNIPGFFPNGVPIKGAYDSQGQGRLPQVGVIYFTNSFGPTRNPDGTSSIISATTLNLSAQRFMTELRKYNSRIGEYEPGDLLQFTIAGVDIFTFIARLGRALQIFHYFSEYNPNARQTALAFMGFKLSEFSDNIKEYEKLYSMMVSEANRILTIPNDMTYLHRKLMLSSNIYIEGKGDNAQLIFAQPLDHFRYNEASASLTPHFLTGSTWWTLAAYRYEFQLMLDAFQNSAFCTTLMADIRSAQGLELYQMPEVDIHKVDIKEIDEVLTQFMNAELLPIHETYTYGGTAVNPATGYFRNAGRITPSSRTFNLYAPAAIINGLTVAQASGTKDLINHYYVNQNSAGFLVQNLSSTGTTLQDYRIYQGHTSTSSVKSACDSSVANFNKGVKLLNFFKNDVTSDDLLVATRLSPTHYWGSDDTSVSGDYDYWFECRTCGTEIPICFMFGFGNTTDFDAVFRYSDYDHMDFIAFNYHPTSYIIQVYQGSYAGGVYPIQQWDKVIEYPSDNAYWLDMLSVKSEIYVNPPSGFKLR